MYIKLMLSKVALLKTKQTNKKKQIADLQAQLEIEMARIVKVSDGTLPMHIGKKKTIVERTAPKVINPILPGLLNTLRTWEAYSPPPNSLVFYPRSIKFGM